METLKPSKELLEEWGERELKSLLGLIKATTVELTYLQIAMQKRIETPEQIRGHRGRMLDDRLCEIMAKWVEIEREIAAGEISIESEDNAAMMWRCRRLIEYLDIQTKEVLPEPEKTEAGESAEDEESEGI